MLNLITENNLSFTKQKCNCGLSLNKKSNKLKSLNNNKRKNKTRQNKTRKTKNRN